MLNTIKKHSTALILSAVVIASFGLVVNAAHASDNTCTLNVMAKNAKSKSVYLSNGEKVSIKTLTKFAGVCTIKTSIMSESQLNAMKVVELKAKLAKLQAK